MANAITIQTGAHEYNNSSLRNYSLMMGGLNVTQEVLSQYDPLIGGYHRLFMIRKPTFLVKSNPNKLNNFKHLLEYGNTGVSGIGDVDLETTEMTGGYAGRSFSIPTVAKDSTNGFSVEVYEFSGGPIREVLQNWINGISDLQSGYAHYNGLIASGALKYSQANHTAEFIYVATDRTGMNVEYACQFANCFPKGYKNDQYNSQAGEHNIVQYQVEFTGTKYEGIDINKKAKILLKNYQVLVNSLEFYSGITAGAGENYTINTETATGYDNTTGTFINQSKISYFTDDSNQKFNQGDTWKRNGTEAIKVTPSFTTKGAAIGNQ